MKPDRLVHPPHRALLCGLLVALTITACGRVDADPRRLSSDQWRHDLAYLAEKLPARHGNAFHQTPQREFESAVQRLDERIPDLEYHQILAEMGAIVALVGDGHTELWLPQKAIGFGQLPIALHYFSGELYIFAAVHPHTDLIGRRVVAFGDTPASTAYERVIPLIGRDNEFEYLRSAPIYLTVPEILQAVGLSASPEAVTLTLAGADGGTEKVTLAPMTDAEPSWVTAPRAAGSEPPLHARHPEEWYWFEYLADSRTLYLQYDRCRDQPGRPSIKKFARELFAFVDGHPVDRMVVDLRRNTGGNFHRNAPLIDGIAKRQRLTQPGALFVITSRTTFSAATIAAIDLKRGAGAIVVGEPSRGKPNGYSDEKHLRLPNSGVEVNYSPIYRERMPEAGDAPYLPVDLPAAPSFDDYRDGRDPVLAAILAYDGGAAADRLGIVLPPDA